MQVKTKLIIYIFLDDLLDYYTIASVFVEQFANTSIIQKQ